MIRRLAVWGVALERFPPRVAPERAAEAVAAGAAHADVVVVDTFPRGLAGELPWEAIRVPAVLVHRPIVPRYAARPAVCAAVDRYALILAPGERGAFAAHPRAVETAPWLIADAGELLPAPVARRELGVRGGAPVVAVLAHGRAAERRRLARIGAVCRSACPDRAVLVLDPRRCWPLIVHLPAIDLVVGSGGYHTVHECRATGTPLLAVAQRRLYDDQRARLHPGERAPALPDLVRLVARHGPARRRRRPAVNGVGRAVAAIGSLLGRAPGAGV